jgi:hypothetical protein
MLLGHDLAKEALEADGSNGTLVLAFGELELLACYQAGLRNVVALPSCSLHQHAAAAPPASAALGPSVGGGGASAATGPGSQFAALDGAQELLRSDKLHRVVIAAPNDAAGFAAGEELARRIGKERCYRVTWPSSPDDNPRLLELRQLQQEQQQQGTDEAPAGSAATPGGAAALAQAAQQPGGGALPHPWGRDPGYRLNALEMAAFDGPEWLAYVLDVQLVEYPVQGLHSFADFWGEIYDYYMQQRPYETGVSRAAQACLAPGGVHTASAATGHVQPPVPPQTPPPAP